MITEVTVSTSKKLNAGNYENKEFFVSLKGMTTNLDAEKEVERLQALAEKLVEAQETRWLQAHKKELLGGILK